MKFTNAFLASLLFFGVTPLALDKKSDEHALTTTSSPFATTSTIALVTPDNAGVVEITGGTHDVLEARARGSRGGASKKTKKTKGMTKKKTKAKGKGKGKSTCTAKQKKAGKCKDTCTAKQKKAGTCPNKKKRNWEVLFPTKGCKPKNAKKGGKATGAKGTKTGSKKTTRELFSPRGLTLSKRAATFEPASRDEAGLMAWTKDVWASSPQVLHMPQTSFKPTSFFKKWSSLGQGINFVTVKSLMGCKSRREQGDWFSRSSNSSDFIRLNMLKISSQETCLTPISHYLD